MPSIPFLKKKEPSATEVPADTAAAPVTETPAAESAVPAPAPEAAVDETTAPSSEASAAPAVEKTVIEAKRGFFSRRRSDNGANASESESEAASPTHSRIPSFFNRKVKTSAASAPAPVKEEDKENAPVAPAETEAAPAEVAPVADTPAPAAEKKEGDKVEEKIRRRISLFQRRNRADGAISEGEVTDGEAAKAAKRSSFWGAPKAAAPTDKKDEVPEPEDPRLTEAKAKVTSANEAESAAKAALESAKKALRDAKASVKAIEMELAAELKKKKAHKEEKTDAVEPAPVQETDPAAPTLPAAISASA